MQKSKIGPASTSPSLPQGFQDCFLLPEESSELFLATTVDGWQSLLEQGIIYAGESHLTSGYKIARSSPDFYSAVYCIDGRAAFETPHGSFECHGGDFVVLPPWVWHRYECDGDWNILWFHFGLACGPWSNLMGSHEFRSSGISAATLGDLMKVFRNEQSTQARSPLLLAAIARCIVLCIERIIRSEETERERQTRAILDGLWRRVGEDVAAPWTVQRLSRIAGTSPAQLHRWCAEQLGTSPMRHVRSMRLRLAAELLASSALTLSEIADRVGYGNAFSLSKALKAELGTPPSQYRAAASTAGAQSRGGAD